MITTVPPKQLDEVETLIEDNLTRSLGSLTESRGQSSAVGCPGRRAASALAGMCVDGGQDLHVRPGERRTGTHASG
jgi:hypothetical protein